MPGRLSPTSAQRPSSCPRSSGRRFTRGNAAAPPTREGGGGEQPPSRPPASLSRARPRRWLPRGTTGDVVPARRGTPPAETTVPGGPRGGGGGGGRVGALSPGFRGSPALWWWGRGGAHPAAWVPAPGGGPGPGPAPAAGRRGRGGAPSEGLGLRLSGAREHGAAQAFLFPLRFTSRRAGGRERSVAGPGPVRLLAPPRASQKRGRRASLPRGPGMCPQAAASAAGGRRAASWALGAHNVCRLLTRRAHGFYARDAGVAHRKNLGLLRKIICQVTAMLSGAG